MFSRRIDPSLTINVNILHNMLQGIVNKTIKKRDAFNPLLTQPPKDYLEVSGNSLVSFYCSLLLSNCSDFRKKQGKLIHKGSVSLVGDSIRVGTSNLG